MQKLSAWVNEQLTASKILAHKYDVLPSDWRRFVEIAKVEGLKSGTHDGDDIVYHKNEIVARYDIDTLEVYTNIEKTAFYKVAAHKTKGILAKLFN